MIRRFIHYYKPYIRLFFADFFCALGVALMGLVFPSAVRSVIDTALPARDLRAVVYWGIFLLLLYLVYACLQFVVDYWGHVLGARIERDMRRDLFAHIHQLPFSYFDNNKTGQIMSRLVNDLNEISEIAHHGPEDAFISLSLLIGTFAIMARMHLPLTLILLVLIPPLLLFSFHWNRRMQVGWRDMRAKLGDINAQVEDSISGVRVVKSFTNEPLEHERFAEGNARFTGVKSNAYYNMASFSTGIELMSNIFNLITLVGGAYFVYRGQMSAGSLTAFLLYVGIFLQPIRRLAALVENYQRGMASFARFVEIMSITPEIEDRKGARDAGTLSGNIQFDNVSFRYEDGKSVLENISLSIRAGQTVALVGPSGGGKTTLCNLIPRFYEVREGAIRIDGTDIRDFTQSSLRRNIGIVQQDVFLFSGTIRENILYARMDATEEELFDAARKASAHDFIMEMPNGYDTPVGQRGVKLSGGQKQRIAIARIFLKNPPILLLDEATSALDNQTERIIQKSLYELSRQRTTLVIAHRLATIQNANRILVMTDAGIVEQGSHDELLALDGLYAQLYQSQFRMDNGLVENYEEEETETVYV